MRLLLQQPSEGLDAPRFVQLMLQADLLGGCTLIRESGQIGGRSQLRREQFPDHDSGIKALERTRDRHIKRGFRLMSPGVESPAPEPAGGDTGPIHPVPRGRRLPTPQRLPRGVSALVQPAPQ